MDLETARDRVMDAMTASTTTRPTNVQTAKAPPVPSAADNAASIEMMQKMMSALPNSPLKKKGPRRVKK